MVIWPAFRMGQYRANDHPYHAPQFSMNLNLSKLPVISDLRSEILSYECECRYWFNENTHLHRQCNYVTRQNIIQKRQYEVLRKRNEFLSTKIKDQGMVFFKNRFWNGCNGCISLQYDGLIPSKVDKENQRKIITTLYADIKDLKSKFASKEQQLLTEINKVGSMPKNDFR